MQTFKYVTLSILVEVSKSAAEACLGDGDGSETVSDLRPVTVPLPTKKAENTQDQKKLAQQGIELRT